MKRSLTSQSSTPQSLVLLLGVALLIGLAMLVALVSTWSTTPAATTTAPAPHFVDVPENVTSAPLRSVVVATAGETLPSISRPDGVLMTDLLAGELPTGAVQAIVRTDSNCQPDEQGVSHCFNQLDFGTTTVVVQHHHDMRVVPCLTPGEVVNVMRVADL